MAMGEIPERMARLLLENYFGYVCTTDREGCPHITPIFFVYVSEENGVYFITTRGSKKVRNLRENEKIGLTVDIRDERNPFNNEGVLVQGVAEVEPLQTAERRYTRLRQVYQGFKEKYRLELAPEKEVEEEVLVRIRIWKMVYWKGPKFESLTFPFPP
jgi:PPOX class probable F420-dependent enzyme